MNSNLIKKFKCDKCKNMHNIVKWKKIFNNNLYLCGNCWKKIDIMLEIELIEKLIKLK